MAKASDNPFPSLLVVEGVAPAAPAAGRQRLFVDSADHTLKRVDSGGVVASVGGGGGGLKGAARAKRTAGSITLTGTTFSNLDTALDLTCAAAAGDLIELRLSARLNAAGAPWCVLDFHTIVAGAPVNSIAGDTAAGSSPGPGHPAWGTASVAAGGVYTVLSGSKRYNVVAGDVDGGQVRLRLRGATNGTVTIAASDPYLYVELTNFGQ